MLSVLTQSSFAVEKHNLWCECGYGKLRRILETIIEHYAQSRSIGFRNMSLVLQTSERIKTNKTQQAKIPREHHSKEMLRFLDDLQKLLAKRR